MALDHDLRLHVPAIDSEHALQIELVEALGRAVGEGQSREVADEILEKLVDLTRVHFLAEELMMRMEGYPAFEAHRGEHGDLLAELRQLKTSCERGDRSVTQVAVDGLRSWLAGHVLTQDRAFANFLATRAAGRAAV